MCVRRLWWEQIGSGTSLPSALNGLQRLRTALNGFAPGQVVCGVAGQRLAVRWCHDSSYITGTDVVVDGGWFSSAPYLGNERSHRMLSLLKKKDQFQEFLHRFH